MKYLFVLAHPDDECDVGGTIHKLIKDGNEVAVVVMVSKALARKNLSPTLCTDEENSMAILGVDKVYHADFPNIRMNVVPHSELTDYIEKCIYNWGAEAIVTHHPSDVNNDHSVTSISVRSACRMFQSKEYVKPLKLILYMESAGATEWSLDVSDSRFNPNYFVEIGREGLQTKIKALEAYGSVVRTFPHPCSRKSYEYLAVFRGSQSGCIYAEAFECAFRRL
jgi:LmbE family N-acetylglucosaminyl deacetylase